jgi:hypothetical protein
MATKTSPKWVQARETMVVILGARNPTFRTAVVRDRHNGRLVEVPLTEYPPLDEGSEGTSYPFARGEKVLDDHPAVVAGPQRFIAVED